MCGELVDAFLNVIVPCAGRILEPRKRFALVAITVAVECGLARLTSGPVTVSVLGWLGSWLESS